MDVETGVGARVEVGVGIAVLVGIAVFEGKVVAIGKAVALGKTAATITMVGVESGTGTGLEHAATQRQMTMSDSTTKNWEKYFTVDSF